MQSQEIGAALSVINKVQTTADGGARITLDLPSISSDLISKLMTLKLQGRELVMVAFVETEE